MFTEGIYPIGDGLLDIDEARLKRLLVQDDINEIYEVEQTPFARGKFAAVRRAIHKNSGVHFAAKFLKRRRRAQSSDKEIKHEIAVLMLCDGSDNIVKLNAVHESRSDTALLLELATGGELQTFLDNEECLSEAQARICMREVLKALQFLHNRSIAHLDLKPQNILLAGEHIEDGLKLCDFGISRVVAEGTNVREIVGTPDYVAPEVLQYEPLSLLTDIWSVGVLTYVLLSGFSPFGGETKQETFLNISQCALTFPDKLFGGVSAPAIDFIRRALRIKPNDRMTAAGCLEHIWLKDECSIDRQIFNNISKAAASVDEDGDEDDDDDEEDEDDEAEVELVEERDECYEDDVDEEDDEEITNGESKSNGHKMESSDAEHSDPEDKKPISNGKINMNGNGHMPSSNGHATTCGAKPAVNGKSHVYTNGKGSSTSTTTKTATAIISVPSARATTIPLNMPASAGVHVASRRHSSLESNKENTFLATKKITSTLSPPAIAKKPTLATATATIVISPTATAATSNQVVTTITLPNNGSTTSNGDKHASSASAATACCIFPDAPTTPKVIRKAPTTDTSPTSVKALVKKFQLEGGSGSGSRATSPAPVAAAIATVHLKESSQQNQQHIISTSNGRSTNIASQRRSSTNSIANGASKGSEKPLTNGSISQKSSSLPGDVIVHQHRTSSLKKSSAPTSPVSPTGSTASAPAGLVGGASKNSHSTASTYKSTCVFCLSCGSKNAASSTGCRHSAGNNSSSQSSNGTSSSSNSSSSSSTNNNNSNNTSATSTAAVILLSNHKQLQHHHHVHQVHHVHHVQKSAANNLSLDQGIIC